MSDSRRPPSNPPSEMRAAASPVAAELIDAAVRALSRADALLVTAGAGMGIDSGLPDFRGVEGLWRAYPALGHVGYAFHEIASPHAFRERPRLAWGFYGHRLAMYRATVPHEGFRILRRWIGAMRDGGFVFTSNVDGQFQTAGFDPERIVEVHGSIHAMQCLSPCSAHTWDAGSFAPVVDEPACSLVGDVPACPHCGGIARPNILMFDDAGWLGARYDAQHDALRDWLARAGRVAVVEIGAGTAVPTVRVFSERIGDDVIRINVREAHARRGDVIGLPGGALETLRALDEAWRRD
ncbi:NAD-dependent protein deacetylase [Burkholderia thailandensis]|uniref:protein acetyllysine N-acetyltransferase n=2 Tax=Burkholderia thailandensis TaxID=57975 RepID=A0AAW9D463_BURTH|nr:Sir2 family NAD-dependent protein deacetylase [Burkholderia thailandensis]AHI63558.1 sir2 family protein [Burkholderia thailandensis H0587]MCS3390948.1 NAD-dependent protein deacetylase [Burkholderia thailandensis]MCS6423615.1 NAD-dependent protein deacetylase [Burkholderia thailandensis]MCS6463172.1 NAD-dependent protein deacetylase [Burkholderia thailandensis]MCS6480985.1 NAD-dependent protein deacetylase [Burkholderia thailandensis]